MDRIMALRMAASRKASKLLRPTKPRVKAVADFAGKLDVGAQANRRND